MEFKATFDLSPIISGRVDGASAIEMLGSSLILGWSKRLERLVFIVSPFDVQ